MKNYTNIIPKLIVLLIVISVTIFLTWIITTDNIQPSIIVLSYSMSLSVLLIAYSIISNYTYQLNYQGIFGDHFLGRPPLIHINTVDQRPRLEDVFLYVDPLTRLLNQQGLYSWLSAHKEVSRAIAFSIQINNFTEITDYYGYEVADNIIIKYASELQKLQRQECIISRISNNQFLVLCLDDEASEAKAKYYLKRLTQVIHPKYTHQSSHIQFSKTIGFSQFPQDTDAVIKVVANARIAMKNAYRKNIDALKYTDEMHDSSVQDIQVANRLQQAIKNKNIEIYFQKIFDTQTGEVLFLEQLARWKDQDLGNIVPENLLSTARSSNQLNLLERYLIKQSIKQYSDYCNHTNGNPKLALNLAPETFLNKDILTYINALVKKYHLHRNQVCIEIAETTFMNEIETCIERINDFKKDGYLIALDDFGKAFSSLSILEKINYDVIKIDRLFTETIDQEKTQEIVRMIQKIATLSSKILIVEGVEETYQKDLLEKLHCTNLQGFLLHRPEKL